MTHFSALSEMEQSRLQHLFFCRNYFSTTVEYDTFTGQIFVLKGGAHEGFEVRFVYKRDVPHLAVCNKPPFLILIFASQTSFTLPNLLFPYLVANPHKR